MNIGIIQARMGATRLPGKPLIKLLDEVTLLEYQIRRTRKSKLLGNIVVATSTEESDRAIEKLCNSIGVPCFRGSESDLLKRYYECAKAYKADVITRLTADCPFSDPEVIDSVIALFLKEKADYAANTVPPETSAYPDGFDVEVFSFSALERAYSEATLPCDREHVTFYFWKYKNGFKCVQLQGRNNFSKYRLTIDYLEDLKVVKFAADILEKEGRFGTMQEVIDILDANPSIKALNSRYYFGIGWEHGKSNIIIPVV